MKSYTQGRNLYGTLTKNANAANLTLGDERANDYYRRLLSKRDWPFVHRLRTATTVAATQFVNLPYDVEQVESLYVTVSTTRYVPKLITSREEWDIINLNTTTTSDIPVYAYIYNGQVGLWPIPAAGGNIISINGKIRPINLSIPDITSTTITTLANGGTALTVNSGLTVQMAGFWINPTFSTTANTGDGQWYELSSVTNGTTAVLVRGYGGQSITAGTAACTIGQFPLLPSGFHDLPWILAAADYWDKEEDPRADKFRAQAAESINALETQYGSGITDLVLDEGMGRTIINPNLTVRL
jgi:hypothetical protein